MAKHLTTEDLRFDNDLDRIVCGEGWPGESVTGGDEYDMELATARMLSAHYVPMRQPPAEVRDRIWRQTQDRIDAQAQSRLQLSSGTHPLLALPRRRLIAVAAVVLLMLSAMTPVGPQVMAMAQEVMEARGWVERAETPGDEGISIEVDGTELPAGAPIVSEDAITVPYDPNVQEQIEPFDPRAEEQVEPASGPGGGTAPD